MTTQTLPPLTAAQVRAMDIRDVVNSPEWQAVRQALVGKWVRHHDMNVSLLRSYLDAQQWTPLAVRQVYNVLTGTVHRVGHTKGQVSTDQLRKEVRISWYNMTGQLYDVADPRFATGVIGATADEAFPK